MKPTDGRLFGWITTKRERKAREEIYKFQGKKSTNDQTKLKITFLPR